MVSTLPIFFFACQCAIAAKVATRGNNATLHQISIFEIHGANELNLKLFKRFFFCVCGTVTGTACFKLFIVRGEPEGSNGLYILLFTLIVVLSGKMKADNLFAVFTGQVRTLWAKIFTT